MTERRRANLRLWVTQRERVLLDEIAAALQLPLASYIRQCVGLSIPKRGRPTLSPPPEIGPLNVRDRAGFDVEKVSAERVRDPGTIMDELMPRKPKLPRRRRKAA